MRNHNDITPIGRRSVLKGAGIGLAGLAGLASPVAAKGGRVSLLDGAAEYQLFWSGADGGDPTDADGLDDFGYPTKPGADSSPFLASEDPDDTTPDASPLPPGFFDGSDIEKTPNGQTLHHTLQFFQGFLMKRNKGKPYVLVNQGMVPNSQIPLFRFEARGQHLNFEAKSSDNPEVQELLGLIDVLGGNPTPVAALTGKKWRAVGSEVVYVLGGEDGKPGRKAPFSATRVDFYDRTEGKPEHALSVVYIIYPNLGLDSDGNVIPVPANPLDPSIQPMPDLAHATGAQLIGDGVRNLGGR